MLQVSELCPPSCCNQPHLPLHNPNSNIDNATLYFIDHEANKYKQIIQILEVKHVDSLAEKTL